MSAEASSEVAREIRTIAAQGRLHGPARELVKMFSLEFTPDAVAAVNAALAHEGLATKPELLPDKPKARVRVVIVGGSSATRNIQTEEIQVLAGEPERAYEVIGGVRARVTAPTAFSKSPTMEEVNLKLREEALRTGANAVINVTYSRGISMSSWRALTAEGTAVVVEGAGAPDTRAQSAVDPLERVRQLADLLAAGAITEEEYAEAKRRLRGTL